MNVMIISSAKNAVGARVLQQNYEDRGHSCIIQDPSSALCDQFMPDVVIPRFSPRSVEKTSRLLKTITDQYPKALLLPNDRSVNLSFNKLSTYKSFLEHNIPTPHTWHKTIDDKTVITLPAVAKPVIGNRGQGIFLLHESSEVVETLTREDYLVQEFIHNPLAHDVRAFVIGDQVVAAMKRIAPEDEFIANLASGGSAVAIHLDDATQTIAVSACKSMNLAIGGVDLMLKGKDYVVLEVNPSPGFKVGEVCGVNIPKLIVEYTEQLIKGMKND